MVWLFQLYVFDFQLKKKNFSQSFGKKTQFLLKPEDGPAAKAVDL